MLDFPYVVGFDRKQLGTTFIGAPSNSVWVTSARSATHLASAVPTGVVVTLTELARVSLRRVC